MTAQPTSGRRTYGGMPLEQRRAERRLRLIDAALDLLSEGGLEKVTVRGVCQRARLADRQFYEQFESCDDLLGGAWDHLMETEVLPGIADLRAKPMDIGNRVRAVTGVAVTVIEEDPRRGALLAHWSESPALRARREQSIELGASLIREHAAPGPPDRDAHLRLTSLLLAAGAAELFAMWARGEVTADGEELARVFVETCLSSPALKR